MNEIRSISNIEKYVGKTLIDSFSKIVKANIITGEFEVYKNDGILNEDGFNDLPDIYSYMRKLVTDKLIYPEYAAACLRYSDSKYVQKKVFSGNSRIVQSYKRRTGSSYRWITFAIIAPECTPDHPWALFTWRDSDTDTIMMHDSIYTLSTFCHKILRINITSDTYEPLMVDESEQRQFVSKISRISEWMRLFAESGYIYSDDIELFLKFSDVESLKTRFADELSPISCRYRRRNGDTYRWAQMDLIPSIEYTESNQVLLLYVKDIHDEYTSEMKSRQELVDSFSHDPLTLLYNRHKFKEDMQNLRNSDSSFITCLYVDVNGLHEINNLLGHQKGDDMLCSVADALRQFFPDESSYRIGGDEFVVLTQRLSKPGVEIIAEEVRSYLLKDNYAVSMGIESGICGENVNHITAAAELAMRKDKEAYYQRHGDMRIKRDMNKELENIMTKKHDTERFLDAIAQKFSGVFFVDPELDTMRHIYISDYFSELLQESGNCFSKAMHLYIDKYVEGTYTASLTRILDYEYLEEKLRNEKSIQLTYLNTDGLWVDLRIMELDRSDNNKPETIWIFSREISDP